MTSLVFQALVSFFHTRYLYLHTMHSTYSATLQSNFPCFSVVLEKERYLFAYFYINKSFISEKNDMSDHSTIMQVHTAIYLL